MYGSEPSLVSAMRFLGLRHKETHIHTKVREVFSQGFIVSHLYKFKHTNANTCPPLFAHTVVNVHEI